MHQDEQEPQDEENALIDWHTAFYEAIQLELAAYRGQLEFHFEFELTAEPLKIDCVVIKKEKGVEIKKNIAAIFREWNILEYKSPEDYVSVSDFYKVYGYAYFYASLKEISITGMTISFIESRYPEKLIKHLKVEHGCAIEETLPGIYTVRGEAIPIQIIDSRRLSAEDNLWVRSLSNRLNFPEYLRVRKEIDSFGKDARVQAYLNVIFQANKKIIQGEMEMLDADEEFMKMLEKTNYAAKLQKQERDKWQNVIADKDAEIMRLCAELETTRNMGSASSVCGE